MIQKEEEGGRLGAFSIREMEAGTARRYAAYLQGRTKNNDQTAVNSRMDPKTYIPRHRT